jgi:uncharacterized membrane protein
MSTILKNNSETVAHTPGRVSSIGVWYLVGALEVAGGVGLLIPALAGLASLGLAALLTGAVITDQFVLEQSPWLPLALLVVAAVIARARWSRTEAVVGTLLRR